MLNYAVQVHSLLIPIVGNRLLLPNANVAEVTHFREPAPVKGAPEWMLGFMQWRELKIPLISFESLIGIPDTSGPGIKWVIVLNALSGDSEMPFFAMVVQGKPSLVKIDESVATPMDRKNEKGVLQHVYVDGDPAIIPDPDVIESMLRDLGGKK